MRNLKFVFALIVVLAIVFFRTLLFTSTSVAGNYGDVYQHYYPLKYLVAEQLISGKLPLWNPYIFTGQPLLANPQSSIFYPFAMVFNFLPLPAAFNYFEFIHIVLAGLFFFLLLKYYKLSDSASITGAIAFCFSSFLISKITAGHPVALAGYIWLPLIILFTENLSREPGPGSVILLSAAVAFQFLSGHTFPLYITLIFILIYTLYVKFKHIKYFCAAGALTLLLSAIQFLPSYELSRVSETANWIKLVENYSMRLSNLLNLYLPDFYGNIIDGTYIHPLNPSYYFEKHCLYLGVIPFVLFLAGIAVSIKKNRYFYPLIFASGLLLSLGFNTPLYSFLYGFMPGLNFLRVPARFIYLSLISVLILSAFAWTYYFKNMSWKIKLLLFLVIFADLFAWGGKYIYPENMDSYRKPNSLSAELDPAYRVITEPGIIMPNRSMLHHHFNLNGYEAIFLKDFTRYLGMQEKLSLTSTGLSRSDLNSPLSKLYSVKYLIGQDTTPHDEQNTASGSGPKPVKLSVLSGGLPKIFFASRLKIIERGSLNEQLNYLGSAVSRPDTELLMMKEDIDSSILKDHTGMLGTGNITSYDCDTDRITAEFTINEPAVIVFSEIFYNGWKAFSGPAEFSVKRGHKVFRAVILPAGDYTGKNRLTLYFRSASQIFGLLITAFAILAIIGSYFRLALKGNEL